MDLDNLRIALRKACICALRDDPQIACSIRGSLKSKGAKHGFGQTMDSSWINGPTAACMALLLCTHVHGKEIINVVQ